MTRFNSIYDILIQIAIKNGIDVRTDYINQFGSSYDILSVIAESIGVSAPIDRNWDSNYEILEGIALNLGTSGIWNSTYDVARAIAVDFGYTGIPNSTYDIAEWLLDNAEAGFGGLCFTAVTSGSIGMSHHGTNATTTIPQLQYSRDGESWTNWMFESLALNAGEKIYFKGINNSMATSTVNYSNFSITGQVKASGNIMSILYGDDYKDKVDLTGKNYGFYNLFGHQTGLISAPKLPATTLAVGVYWDMFAESGLLEMPELPATTLALSCYSGMFRGCTSLTRTKVLPAKTLTIGAYLNMFNGCSNLREVTAYFTSNPAQSNTGNWLAGVAAEGTFYVASDAAWVDDVEFGPNTIPVGWTISGRIPHRNVNVTIDGVVYSLPTDQTFAQLGYTELYSQENYYPRFGQTAHDFTYNVNSHPMSGLELFTTCTPAVHMIDVTVDGNSYEVNYYTSWFANGFNELYTQYVYDSEEEVEEIDVDTTYPNEGDSFYTSYLVITDWMRYVSERTGIPAPNLAQAEKTYRFVDYLESTGTEWIDTGMKGNETSSIRFEYKLNNTETISGTKGILGARSSATSNSINISYASGQTMALDFQSSNTNRLTISQATWRNTDWHKVGISYERIYWDDLGINCSNVTNFETPIELGLFRQRSQTNWGYTDGSIKYYIHTKSSESQYLIPCLNSSNTPIMLDVMTMTEFENAGTGSFKAEGGSKTLEDKFKEMGYDREGVHIIQRTFTFDDMTEFSRSYWKADATNISERTTSSTWTCGYIPVIEDDIIYGVAQSGTNPVAYITFDSDENTLRSSKTTPFDLVISSNESFLGINSSQANRDSRYVTITRTITGEIPEGWTEINAQSTTPGLESEPMMLNLEDE